MLAMARTGMEKVRGKEMVVVTIKVVEATTEVVSGEETEAGKIEEVEGVSRHLQAIG
jgi:hypothetical protein